MWASTVKKQNISHQSLRTFWSASNLHIDSKVFLKLTISPNMVSPLKGAKQFFLSGCFGDTFLQQRHVEFTVLWSRCRTAASWAKDTTLRSPGKSRFLLTLGTRGPSAGCTKAPSSSDRASTCASGMHQNDMIQRGIFCLNDSTVCDSNPWQLHDACAYSVLITSYNYVNKNCF